MSCYDNGTSKFKECPFIVGGEVKKGNFFALSCPTRGIHEQMHYYFSKCSITFSTYLLLMSMSFLIPSERIFLLAFEATYALCPWPLLYLNINYL